LVKNYFQQIFNVDGPHRHNGLFVVRKNVTINNHLPIIIFWLLPWGTRQMPITMFLLLGVVDSDYYDRLYGS
jgi:hypothetical protein